MRIFSLTYVSSASGLYRPEIFRDIALHSAHFNQAHSITGMLLVYNETVIQFLEGPEVEVKQLYHKIERDKRHKGSIVVSTRSLDSREFPEWSMGYQEIIDISDPKFIFGLDSKALDMHFPKNTSGTTEALLSSFKRSSGLGVLKVSCIK